MRAHTNVQCTVGIHLIERFAHLYIVQCAAEFNKFDNNRARMLDSIYYMTLKLF